MMEIMGIGEIEYIRCLIGVSLITGLILVIRKYLGKQLSRKMIYGMWLMIPIYMILLHFVSIPMPRFMNDIMPAGLQEVLQYWGTNTSIVEESVQIETIIDVQVQNDITSQALHTKGMTVGNKGERVTSQGVIGQAEEKRINLLTIVGSTYLIMLFLFFGTVLFINARFMCQSRRKRTYIRDTAMYGLAVYRLSDISSPFLLGKTVYVPSDMEEEQELYYALLHEECHYKQGDAFWVVLRYLILGVFFYNPMIWLAFKYSGYDCELACDEAVAEKLQETDRKKYGGCLLRAVEKSKGIQAHVIMSTNLKSNKRLIRERIENLVMIRKKSYMAMFLAFTMLFIVISCFLLEAEPVKAEALVGVLEEKFEAVVLNQEMENRTYTAEGNTAVLTDEKEQATDTRKPVFHIPSDWEYQLQPYKITDFLDETGKEAKDGYLFGFEERFTDYGDAWWQGTTEFYTNVMASSELEPQGKFAYAPDNVSTPSRYCIWSEGVEGYGIGEWIELSQLYQGEGDEWLLIDELCIVNGYAENETKWTRNSRVKSLKFYYEDIYMGTICLEDTIYPQYFDVSELQMYVPNGMEADFRFEIAEVYEGSKYEDTCITGIEIGFQGKGEH